MLPAGTDAPDFSVPDSHGQTHSLASQRGKWVLLWWYPEAGSGSCSIQAASLGTRYEDFQQAGVTVWGISFNTVERNDAFSCDYDLGFPLLSDVDHTVGQAYGVTRAPDERFADKPRRVSFVIDPHGQIAFSELVPNESLPAYADRALVQIRSAQVQQ